MQANKDVQDELARAYYRIKPLRENLPTGPNVRETFVEQFHEGLGRLESLGISVEEFKVPDRLLRVFDSDFPDERWVDRAILASKMDAALGYFHWRSAAPPPVIEFGGRRKA